MKQRNAADEQSVKDSSKKQNERRRQDIEDIRTLLKSPNGRRFLWRFIEYCGVFKLSADFHNGSRTYFNEGHRNVGNMLVADIAEADPEALVKMMLESKLQEGDNE